MSDPYGAYQPSGHEAQPGQPSPYQDAPVDTGAYGSTAALGYGAEPAFSAGSSAPWAAYGQPMQGDPGDINLPWYGIGFVDAIKRGFAKACPRG